MNGQIQTNGCKSQISGYSQINIDPDITIVKNDLDTRPSANFIITVHSGVIEIVGQMSGELNVKSSSQLEADSTSFFTPMQPMVMGQMMAPMKPFAPMKHFVRSSNPSGPTVIEITCKF